MNANKKPRSKGRQQEYVLLKVDNHNEGEYVTAKDVLEGLKEAEQAENNQIRFCLESSDAKTRENCDKTWSYFVGTCVKKKHRGPKVEGTSPPIINEDEKDKGEDDHQGSRFFVISNQKKKLCIFAHNASYGDVKSNISTLLKPIKFINAKKWSIAEKIAKIEEIQSIRIAFNSKELHSLKANKEISLTNLSILETPIFNAPIKRKLWLEKSLPTKCIGHRLQELLKSYLNRGSKHSPENLINFLQNINNPADLRKLRRIEQAVLLALCLGNADYFRIKGRHNVADLAKNDTLTLINGQLHPSTSTVSLVNQLVAEIENLNIAA